MAKHSNVKASDINQPISALQSELDRWKDVEVKVAGYWTEDGPLIGKVIGARSWMAKTGRQTTLFMLELLRPANARVKLDGGGFDETTLGVGEIIGVFESAGNTSLRMLMNARVAIERKGEIKMGAGKNPMKAYRIRTPDAKQPVIIEELQSPRAGPPDRDIGKSNLVSIDDIPF